jgi:hypothetical protein
MRTSRLWLPGFLFLWLLGLPPYPATAGTVETRINDTVIQNFLERLFPITLNHKIDLLGIAQIPVTIQLSHPRSLLTERGTGDKIPCLQVTMDYELTNVAGNNNPARGEITGDMHLSVSPDSEYLVLTAAETFLPVAPGLKIGLHHIIKPARIPLFKSRPITVNGQKMEAQFFGMELRVQNGELVIGGDVRFVKK